MPPVDPYIELYKQGGVALLFIALFLTACYFLYKALVSQKEENLKIAKNAVDALRESTDINISVKDALKELRDSVQDNSASMTEFMAYLRGRDAGGIR
jgi:HAMP domain-containing protein